MLILNSATAFRCSYESFICVEAALHPWQSLWCHIFLHNHRIPRKSRRISTIREKCENKRFAKEAQIPNSTSKSGCTSESFVGQQVPKQTVPSYRTVWCLFCERGKTRLQQSTTLLIHIARKYYFLSIQYVSSLYPLINFLGYQNIHVKLKRFLCLCMSCPRPWMFSMLLKKQLYC